MGVVIANDCVLLLGARQRATAAAVLIDKGEVRWGKRLLVASLGVFYRGCVRLGASKVA